MGYTVVVAEKPSVGTSIAKVIGADTRKDGYLEGNGYKVTWCIGHLVGLSDADAYDARYSKWAYDDLPILPEAWRHEVLPQTEKQFRIIKSLMNDESTECVTCATDCAREGELIFRLVYEQAGCRKPVKRLWISSLEESAIRKGMEELRDGHEFDALYESALSREKADWLVGINMSRLFSVLYHKTLKVGRVQTPTLAMIVARDAAISEFRKEKYYIVHLKADGLDAVSGHIADKAEADKIALACQGKPCRIGDTKQKREVIKAPKLYDLTTLQRECNRLFGMTAERTLACTQSLYEKKLVTYPRTDSRFLTEDMEETAKKVIDGILDAMPFANGIRYSPDIRKVMDNSKVNDHHAIIPTIQISGEKFSELSGDEKKVFSLIAGKLLAATMQDYIYVVADSTILCEGYVFTSKAKTVTQEGFKSIENAIRSFFKLRQNGEKGAGVMPELEYGSVDTVVSEQFTKPPKQYTEDTLLSAMQTAGNEELTEETEKQGIGTPATRAAIIEKIIKCGFVRREKKHLVPTKDGIALITILPEELVSPKMTADWEMELTRIAQDKADGGDFIHGIEGLVRDLVGRYSGMSVENTAFSDNRRKSMGDCPRCGKPVYEYKGNYYCSSRECDFSLWKNNRFFESVGATLDRDAAKDFLSKGRHRYRNLVSKKTGNTFTADIVMEVPKTGYVRFKVEFPERRQKERKAN